MLDALSPLEELRRALAQGETTASRVAVACASRANANASRNTYLHFDAVDLARRAAQLPPGPLYGVPISLKDCFDLAGTVTTCGSRFYAQHRGNATTDSSLATRLLAAGALITGKTHLHQLAYGITGQNADFGDCLQPRDQTLLTGGSSSGAAASVQEGSALAAIGTDTGGSIRVPAALCGLVGYRASHALAFQHRPGLWDGGVHLAPSFDTPGFLLRDPRDAEPIAAALFGVIPMEGPHTARIGFVDDAFFPDATDQVLEGYARWRQKLLPAESFDPTWWHTSREIFAGIQAHEAASLHAGHFDQFEPSIAQRLHWGASLTEVEVADLRARHASFRASMAELFASFDLLMLPCAPVSTLVAAEDQSETRAAILRYTTPFSLAGVPVITLPGELIGAPRGTGVQIAAAAGEDAMLLAFARQIGDSLAQAAP